MNDHTVLYRQIHPDFIDETGSVTSQAFRPSRKDSKCLSVYDGDRITAEAAWQHYVQCLQHCSIGVLAITVQDCQMQQLPVSPAPKIDFPEHAVIDFSKFGEGAIRCKSKKLRNAAKSRDWQYRAQI